MKRLGIISGTLSFRGKGFLETLKEKKMKNKYGAAFVLVGDSVAFVPRHGSDPKRHILPHLVNHQANLQALKDLGVDEVIAVHSTGSLKRILKPGTLVVPSDFMLLSGGPTVFDLKPIHITPTLNHAIRQKWMDAARDIGVAVVDGGIYWQTKGPRLETRAEIAMMAEYADLVGMTMAGEAVIAQELDLPYASLCSVDNFAHGIGKKALTMDEILLHARRNTAAVARIVTQYLKRREV